MEDRVRDALEDHERNRQPREVVWYDTGEVRHAIAFLVERNKHFKGDAMKARA